VASADTWDWLPTSRDQADPIHGEELIAEAEVAGLGLALRSTELIAARKMMTALRSVPESLSVLVDGPHDFTPAAKGGAKFAARIAAREMVVGRPGFWWRVIGLFAAGYWPCGLVRGSEQIVVF
jgi:hypothetical protein